MSTGGRLVRLAKILSAVSPASLASAWTLVACFSRFLASSLASVYLRAEREGLFWSSSGSTCYQICASCSRACIAIHNFDFLTLLYLMQPPLFCFTNTNGYLVFKNVTCVRVSVLLCRPQTLTVMEGNLELY